MGRIYLIRRQAFNAQLDLCNELQNDRDHGTRVPIATYTNLKAAEAHRNDLALGIARTMNPFVLYINCREVKLNEAFRIALYDLDITDCEIWDNQSADWAGWYDRILPTLTDAQRVGVWELFAARPVYEVVPIEMED